MIATLVSAALAAILFFTPLAKEKVSTVFLGSALLAGGLLVFAIYAFSLLLALSSLCKAEQNLTPRLLETLKRSPSTKISHIVFPLFLLYTLFSTLEMLIFGTLDVKYLLMAWIVFFGVCLDLLMHQIDRITNLLNPFYVVESYSESAEKGIEAVNIEEICDWIDTLSETSLKTLSRDGTSLSLFALDKLRIVAHRYLESCHEYIYGEEESKHISYVLFYLFQRLELIFDRALKDKIEPVCSGVITALGKIAIYSAELDITLTSYPLHYLGKFVDKAQSKGMQEVANRATLTLLEVGKVITDELDLKYLGIKEAFTTILHYMDAIAKKTFREDKTINIKVLTSPIEELKGLFKGEKLSGHQDTPELLIRIDRVLDEFATLETVMRTIPPVPEMLKEKLEKEVKPRSKKKLEEPAP